MKRIKVKPIERKIAQYINKEEPLPVSFLKLWLKPDSPLNKKKLKGKKIRHYYADGLASSKEFDFKKSVFKDEAVKRLNLEEALAEFGQGYSTSIISSLLKSAKTVASEMSNDFWHLRIWKRKDEYFFRPTDNSGIGLFFDSDPGHFGEKENRLTQFEQWKERGLRLDNIGAWISLQGKDFVELVEREKEKVLVTAKKTTKEVT